MEGLVFINCVPVTILMKKSCYFFWLDISQGCFWCIDVLIFQTKFWLLKNMKLFYVFVYCIETSDLSTRRYIMHNVIFKKTVQASWKFSNFSICRSFFFNSPIWFYVKLCYTTVGPYWMPSGGGNLIFQFENLIFYI